VAQLKIGIDATTWWNRRGFGRFTRQIVRAMLDAPLGHEFVLFVDRPPTDDMLRPWVTVRQVETSETVTQAAVADGSRKLSDLLRFRAAVSREALDVFYFPAVYSWYPTGGRAPVVVTFHDAIAEHYPGLVLPHLRQRLLWKAKTWLATRSASRIATVSNSARDEIVRYLHIPAEKMEVILEAADPEFSRVESADARAEVRARLGLPRDARFILYVGGLAPHKNIGGLFRGFARAIESGKLADDVALFIAGGVTKDGFHSDMGELTDILANEPLLADRVHFTGFIADSDLPALYSDALCVAMPAFSEGFGLPAAEAIACGTPVIATADGAVAEFVQDAGVYFDPADDASIARAIIAVANDPALLERLRAAAPIQSAKLDWTRSASDLLAMLERTARG
jgi:glycosyltransferase involved in cell wall biosynthesis